MKSKRTLITLGLLFGSMMLVALAMFSLTAPSAIAVGGQIENEPPLIDDFEDGLPAGWFQYGDYGSGTWINHTPEVTNTRPGGVPTTTVLAVSYNSAGWGAGTGHDLTPPQDWSAYDGFSFWFYGANTGGTFRVILSDNRSDPGSDTSERFAYEFVDDSVGWRYISIPWALFFRDYAYQPPGAPDDGLTLTEMWAYALALPIGTTGTVYLDDVGVYKTSTIDDFEAGLPAGWFQYGDYGSGTWINHTPEVTSTRPGGTPTTTVLAVSYNSAGWGAGTGHDLTPPQDWSAYDGFRFWFYGANTGGTFRVILSDNRSDPGSDTSERFAYEFVDDSVGWRYISIPWALFFRDYAYQPPGAPDDGLTLTEMWAYALALPIGTTGTVYLDDVGLFGLGQAVLTVSFDAPGYTVAEGGTATITATLNMTATYPVTVAYATADGTATAGNDYVAVSGTLVFPASTQVQTFTVTSLDNADEGDKTVLLNLSAPISVELGTYDQATLTILDDDASPPNPCGRKVVLVDDFEDGLLPSGVDGDGVPVGFLTWSDGSGVAITTTQVSSGDPLALPGQVMTNTLLKLDTNVGAGGWAGFTHAFQNATADQWVPQDWSGYEGLALWVYGNNTGGTLFVDILDNRNPGSTSDDAERFSYGFTDDFTGWQYVEIPFSAFSRKDIGNGAPNDGFGRTEVHGWAFGAYGSVAMGAQTNYLDEIGLMVRTTIIDDFEDGQLPHGLDGDGLDIGFFTWGDGATTVAITTTLVPTDGNPLALPCQVYSNTILQIDNNVSAWGGLTHHFENQEVDTWVPQDWSDYKGISFWLYGQNTGTTVFFEVQDNRNPNSTVDDTEVWSYPFPDDFVGWQYFEIPFTDFARKEIGNGAPNDGFGRQEVHGWAFGSLTVNTTYYLDNVEIYGSVPPPALEVAFAASDYAVAEGQTALISVTLNMTSTEPVTVSYKTAESRATPDRDYLPVSGTLVIPAGSLVQTFAVETLQDAKYEGDERIALHLFDAQNAALGFVQRAVLLIEDDETQDPALLDDFEGSHSYAVSGTVSLGITEIAAASPMALPGQGDYEQVLSVDYGGAQRAAGSPGFGRTFGESQDWSADEGLSFWYYGSNSGDTITVQVYDNQAATTGQVDPADWVLAWGDEFDDAAGTQPDPSKWSHEIGDGALNDNPGWGNGEFEFYTDSPDNAATDGLSNLVITARAVDTTTSDLLCWYGPCEYTSARLLTSQKAEFAYGRIEARLQVPYGNGLWPAFWALGNNISQVDWPTCGEIDIMENIGIEPTIVHGTIHGPGYSGGNGIGGSYTLPAGNLSDEFHTFAVEWTPDQIRWFIDTTNYFTAAVSDIPSGTQWVYDHAFFLLLNVAVGGNWPGNPDETTTFPQTMKVDYVHVYGAADTAERFETTFVDNFFGWKKITVRFDDLTRSAEQPAGAPDDGLGLTEVWGYGFKLPAAGSGSFYLDQVHLEAVVPLYHYYFPLILVPVH